MIARSDPEVFSGQGINKRSDKAKERSRNLEKNPHAQANETPEDPWVSDTGSLKITKFMYFYHPDHLGSTSYVTDGDGELYEHVAYFPFGESWVTEATNSNNIDYLFTSKEMDLETGLYYFGARYYDARTSIWVSPDPIGQHLNLYTYSRNNPIRYIDPTGLADFEVDDQGTMWATVAKGDSLSKIGGSAGLFPFNTSANSIAEANDLDNPDLIHPGQRLKMPGKYNNGRHRGMSSKLLNYSQQAGQFNKGVLKGAVSIIEGVSNYGRVANRLSGVHGKIEQRRANLEASAVDELALQYIENSTFRSQVNAKASKVWKKTVLTPERYGILIGRSAIGLYLRPYGGAASVGDGMRSVEENNGVVDIEKMMNSLLYGSNNK